MAGVASDRRWPRLVRGSDASVQGLRVISVQLCSHRCAPRRAAGGLQASASAPESLMGAQQSRTACRPTQAQLTGRIIRTTSIEPAAAKAGFATTIAIRRRPQADWPECTCPEGVPQLSGGARTVGPFYDEWGQWVVWGSSGPSVRNCTAHLQRQPCRCGLCCYARRSRCSWLRRRGYRGHAPALHRPWMVSEIRSSKDETGRRRPQEGRVYPGHLRPSNHII